MKHILVVDDDLAHLKMLETLIKEWQYIVFTADDGRSAVERVKKEPFDLVLMDMKMARMSGMEALQRIREYNPSMPVIIMTAYSSVKTAITAMKIGAYDYLTKPLDFDKLKLTMERVFERKALKSENRQLKEQLRDQSLNHDIIGKSPAILFLLDTIKMVAPTDANVLITGESGTGKELVSSAIHNNSERQRYPFVRINCAAITETLLASELFGHEKGAFTGADKKRKGKFLLADKGSILLDEIGEMNLSMQAKLLRVIQEKEITPVGSDQSIRTDVRIIAATNKDLKERSEKGLFRQDLFYRLNVVNIEIPPLRHRPGDIPEMALYFLKRFSKQNKRDIKGFTPNALDAMLHHKWQGNVRELMNCVERAVVLSRSDHIGKADLSFMGLKTSGEEDLEQGFENIKLSQVEKKVILSTLTATGGNKSEASRRLGITRKTLLKKLKHYGGTVKS